MLNILRKTISSTARIHRRSTTPINGGDNSDELSTWEIVDSPLSDNEDNFSLHSDTDTLTDESVSESDEEKEEEKEVGDTCDSAPPDDVTMLRSLSVSPPITLIPVEVTRHLIQYDDYEEEEQEEEEEDDVYGYDYDDELVPWKLKDKYGKQRIKKLGKRGGGGGGPKFSKAKKLPCYFHNRPGKHGLGVQHPYI